MVSPNKAFTFKSFSDVDPSICKYWLITDTCSFVNPRPINSASTFSNPILSSLSIAIVMSVSLPGPPHNSASPAKILRLFIFISTGMFS